MEILQELYNAATRHAKQWAFVVLGERTVITNLLRYEDFGSYSRILK